MFLSFIAVCLWVFQLNSFSVLNFLRNRLNCVYMIKLVYSICEAFHVKTSDLNCTDWTLVIKIIWFPLGIKFEWQFRKDSIKWQIHYLLCQSKLIDNLSSQEKHFKSLNIPSITSFKTGYIVPIKRLSERRKKIARNITKAFHTQNKYLSNKSDVSSEKRQFSNDSIRKCLHLRRTPNDAERNKKFQKQKSNWLVKYSDCVTMCAFPWISQTQLFSFRFECFLCKLYIAISF